MKTFQMSDISPHFQYLDSLGFWGVSTRFLRGGTGPERTQIYAISVENACWAYMNEAVTENHRDWIDCTLKALLDDQFRVIIMNNINREPARKFYNSTFFVTPLDFDYLDRKIRIRIFSYPVLRRPTRRPVRMIT